MLVVYRPVSFTPVGIITSSGLRHDDVLQLMAPSALMYEPNGSAIRLKSLSSVFSIRLATASSLL